MKLFRYILGRIGRSLISLFLICLLVFLMMRALPTDRYFGTRADHLTPEEKESILKSYGLTDPIPVQFAKYINGVLHGDLGTSITYYRGKSVTEIIAPKIGYSIRFGLASLALSLVLGISLGLVMVRNQGKWRDHAGNGFILFINAVPSAVYYLFIQFIGTKLLNIGMLYKEGNIATCILPTISMSPRQYRILCDVDKTLYAGSGESGLCRACQSQGNDKQADHVEACSAQCLCAAGAESAHIYHLHDLRFSVH